MTVKEFRHARDEKIMEFIGDNWTLTKEVAKFLETDCTSTNEILKSMAKRGLLESKRKMVNKRRMWRTPKSD